MWGYCPHHFVIDPSAIESGPSMASVCVSRAVTMPALVLQHVSAPESRCPLPRFPYLPRIPLPPRHQIGLPGCVSDADIGALSSNSTPFGYWTRYNGTPLYNAETNMTAVTSAAAQKYLELFKDYRDNGLVPPADIASGFAETNADTSMIIAGKAAIGFIWTNQLNG